MYSQNYQTVDSVLYPPQPQQTSQHYQQQIQLSAPLHSTVVSRHQKEPLPSATDDKPNVVLTTNEIAEFSSTMVHLMWHIRRPSVMDLHSNSKSNYATKTNNSLEQTKITADMASRTSSAFKKFCKQILNATQLSESVVLLSLKYIAMLLQNNPHIVGADGSEYRLFTVALMLANKFLDDNTFTNKTWSEVSGMKVTDLNIMELEFLDVLKFRLSVRKEEYERWRTALFGFRNQLMNLPAEIQRQKLMETMALSVGNTQQQWIQQHQHIQQQQQQQQYQLKQQRAAVVAAVTPNFFLFSKSQQQYPVQPTFNGPLTRVPLRIPTQPLHQNNRTTSSAPAPVSVYDNQQVYSTNSNRRPVATTEPVYSSYPQSQSLPRNNAYSQPKVSPFTAPQQNYTTRVYPPTTATTTTVTTTVSNINPMTTTVNTASNTNTRASHRTSSLPQVGSLDLSVKNSSYYYTPPTTTNTGYNGNTSTSAYSTTSYYVDPTSTNTPTVLSSSQNSDYNPYNSSTNMNESFNRPMMPRSTSYKNVLPQLPTPKSSYNGPTPEDPLTAADSYRTHH